MSSIVLQAESPQSLSDTGLPVALLVSIVLHAALAYTAHVVWPMMFSAELKTPAKTISVVLMDPEPLPEPEQPEPIVEEPPPPPPPLPKPEKKPEPVKQEPKPVKRVVKTPTPPVPKTDPKPEARPTPPQPAAPAPAAIAQDPTPVTPRPIYRPEPAYPMLARRLGQQGTVVLELTLTQSGSVSRAMVIESSGYRSLDSSALDAVKKWRFPANRFNGLSSFRQRIEFRLDS